MTIKAHPFTTKFQPNAYTTNMVCGIPKGAIPGKSEVSQDQLGAGKASGVADCLGRKP